MYKERYVLGKVTNPEALGKPGKHYSVSRYTPIEGGSCLAHAGTRYFGTREEAEAYQEAQEARLKAKEGAKV